MKMSLILSSLLLCVMWAAAQTYPNQSSNQTSSQASSTAGQTTVQGCLSGSNGNYSLADSSGNTYQLAGDTSKLSEHVGHTVEITGTAASSSASSKGTSKAPSSSSGANAQPTLNVSSVKHISSSCSSNR